MPGFIRSLKSKSNSKHSKPEVDNTIVKQKPKSVTKSCFNICSRKVKPASPKPHLSHPKVNESKSSVLLKSFKFKDFVRYPLDMFTKNSKPKEAEVYDTVADGLKQLYKNKLYPLEEAYKYHDFHSPALHDPDFDAKPMVLLIGQYSTGKTTFIKYLLESDFPGIRIGPEPTTDRFIAVMHGKTEGVIPGNALVVDPKKQFRPLSKFGNTFLNRLQCSTLDNKVLESLTIIDTPGILSGAKQNIDRGYDFSEVVEWFAERVDRIVLLFDAHKLDISDEFKRVIELMRKYDEKIRIVLNKADGVDEQQLMRVYGALMWSLGKVLSTPEVARVYIGSFWDKPLQHDSNRRLFDLESKDLFSDLQSLPRNAALRKLNDLIKRSRSAKVHAIIISHLKKQMPALIGKESKKKELIQRLPQIFNELQCEYQISPGDFPEIQKMQSILQHKDFSKFNTFKPKLLEQVDKMLECDIASLMVMISADEVKAANATKNSLNSTVIRGGAFESLDPNSPFNLDAGIGIDEGKGETEWIVEQNREEYDSQFNSMCPIDGKVSGRMASIAMLKSKLKKDVLGKIWNLSDIDKDGHLDVDEFALAMHLISIKQQGYDLPSKLPEHLYPPSKREEYCQ